MTLFEAVSLETTDTETVLKKIINDMKEEQNNWIVNSAIDTTYEKCIMIVEKYLAEVKRINNEG